MEYMESKIQESYDAWQNAREQLIEDGEECNNPMGCACKEANGYCLTDCEFFYDSDEHD